MDGLAPSTPTQTAKTLSGTVTAVDEGGFIVTSGAAAFRALRAVSCLVEPLVGDGVLVARTAEGDFVLAVLTRSDGDVELKVTRGRMRITAPEGVAVVGAEVSVTAGTVNLRAAAGQVVVQALDYVGASVRAEVERSSLVADAVEHVIGRLRQRVQRSYRVVEEHDHLRAARVDYVAEKTMNLHAANVVLTSEGLVKVDGEQIHVG